MNVRYLLRRLRARFPENLPRDSESMDRFANDFLTIYNFPITHDYKRAVLKAVHGLSQATHRAPKHSFYQHMARFEVMRAAVVSVSEIEKQEAREKIEKQAATPKLGSPPEPQIQEQGI